MRDLRHIETFAQQLRTYWDDRYDGLRPTVKQATILADRSIPKPATRREATAMIRDISIQEKWGDK